MIHRVFNVFFSLVAIDPMALLRQTPYIRGHHLRGFHDPDNAQAIISRFVTLSTTPTHY